MCVCVCVCELMCRRTVRACLTKSVNIPINIRMNPKRHLLMYFMSAASPRECVLRTHAKLSTAITVLILAPIFFISKSQKSMKSNFSQICVSEHFSFANRTTSIVHEREYFLIGFGQWAHVSCVHSSIFPLIHCFPPFCLLFLQDPSLWPSDDSIHLVSEQFLVPEEGLEGIRCGEGHLTRRVRLLSC